MWGWAKRAIDAYGVVEFFYSVLAGKSLLVLAAISWGTAVISVEPGGWQLSRLDDFVLIGGVIYAALAFGWLASILAYRKISPKHKFVISGFSGNRDLVPEDAEKADGFQVVLHLKNLADFPISYFVEGVDFKIHNTSPPAGIYHGAIIDAQQPSNFFTEVIKFHHPLALPVSGKLFAKVRYGRPGKEKFVREVAIETHFRLPRFEWVTIR